MPHKSKNKSYKSKPGHKRPKGMPIKKKRMKAMAKEMGMNY